MRLFTLTSHDRTFRIHTARDETEAWRAGVHPVFRTSGKGRTDAGR